MFARPSVSGLLTLTFHKVAFWSPRGMMSNVGNVGVNLNLQILEAMKIEDIIA